jgi:Holliday junction resolvasome RuvABC DNA-binding subunit
MSVRVRHADGTDYGQSLQPNALDVQTKLFSALRGLGFREREVRAVLAELRQDEELRGASIERLLREGLRRIPLPRTRQ